MSTATNRRQAVAALAAERARQGAGRRLLGRTLGVGTLLLLLGLAWLWASGVLSSPPAVAEVRQMVDRQVAEYERVSRGEVPFESAPSFEPLIDKMRSVPKEYRDQAGEQMSRLFAARERAEMASYFQLPPAQRQAELDRRIRAEEARRKAREAEREKRNQDRSNGGGPGQSGQQAGPPAQAAASGGPNGAAGGGAGGRGPAAGRTEDGRNERMKRRLDQSSPESRAQQAEYRRAMDARRKALGLPAGGGRRGG